MGLMEQFQSHLRLIHPIHWDIRCVVRQLLHVSIASAPHPPYPQMIQLEHLNTPLVSIASAPHPPYPLGCATYLYQDSYVFQSHLRLIHPIHQRNNPDIGLSPHWFQLHLRLIHPIHFTLFLKETRHYPCFNCICASSTLSTLFLPSQMLLQISFNCICASSTLSTHSHLRISNGHQPFQLHLRLIHPIHNGAMLQNITKSLFQLHLRLIHPIHLITTILSMFHVSFNCICASSTLSTQDQFNSRRKICCFNCICASSTLSTAGCLAWLWKRLPLVLFEADGFVASFLPGLRRLRRV